MSKKGACSASVKDFVPLHLHSEFSCLDGMIPVKRVVDFACEKGLPGIAITDHGDLGALPSFYSYARQKGINPVLGCEFYQVSSIADREESRDRNHLVVYASSDKGWKNLVRLSTLSYTEGFYYRPRVDWEMLDRHSEGLVVTTACLGGAVPRCIERGNSAQLTEELGRLKEIFRDKVFLEFDANTYPEQRIVNLALQDLSCKYEIPTVASSDAHYYAKEDFKSHEIFLCVQTSASLSDEKRLSFKTPDFYLDMSSEEILQSLSYLDRGVVESSLENCWELSQSCQADIGLGKVFFPQYPESRVPRDVPRTELTPQESYLVFLCKEGWVERLLPKLERDGKLAQASEYRDRLSYEYRVIRDSGFVDYFLLVVDYVRWANENRILVGPGRGSVAGSLVSYLLGITQVDPIEHGLWFERFITQGRKNPPDADLDFQSTRRDEVKEYLARTYGQEHVASIGTYNYLRDRAVIRDVGRALEIPIRTVDQILDRVSLVLYEHRGEDIYDDSGIGSPDKFSLTKALQSKDIRRDLSSELRQYSELFEHSVKLEGLVRQSGMHAAGVVVSSVRLGDSLPLRVRNGIVTTQFDYREVEEFGFLKVDVLGLRNLDTVRQCLDLIKERHGIDIDVYGLPQSEERVWDMIGSGNSYGIFQVEASFMTSLACEFKPRNLSELALMVALGRPGPLSSGGMGDFIKRRRGEIPVRYPHPSLEAVLGETLGVFVYQEQIISTCVELAGYTAVEADKVRYILGKMKLELMKEERGKFVQGCVDNGVPRETAELVFSQMEGFGVYGFNKAHAISYATLAYITAWLKCCYPLEMSVALLNTCGQERVLSSLAECQQLGIKVLPPDINESRLDYHLVDDMSIRGGFSQIKFVGGAALRTIVGCQPFSDFKDFYSRVDRRKCNKSTVEALVSSGVFNCWSDPEDIRKTYYELRGEEYTPPSQLTYTSYEALKSASQLCLSCAARQNCEKVVFGSGSVPCKLMLVGRDPGSEEDKQGIAFVGRAGQLLRKVLKLIGIEEFYITNVSKCKPQRNKFPGKRVAQQCMERWLVPEIHFVNPSVMVTFGAEATSLVLGQDVSVSLVRGKQLPLPLGLSSSGGRIVVPTLHPAAYLYQTSRVKRAEIARCIKSDLQLAKELVDSLVT